MCSVSSMSFLGRGPAAALPSLPDALYLGDVRVGDFLDGPRVESAAALTALKKDLAPALAACPILDDASTLWRLNMPAYTRTHTQPRIHTHAHCSRELFRYSTHLGTGMAT